jgi:hypothetical protein
MEMKMMNGGDGLVMIRWNMLLLLKIRCGKVAVATLIRITEKF